MDTHEFENWLDFYLIQPFDDVWRYQKPAAIVAAYTSKIGKGPSVFEDMMRPPQFTASENGATYVGIDAEIFKSFGVK